MQTFLIILFFLYGIVFGSFYNVVIYRMPHDLSISKGRSFCPKCNTGLKIADLVPVFSFVFLGGKCRYCNQKISFRYPAIEILTGVLFALAYYIFGLSANTFFIIAFWSYLLIVAMIDIDTKMILDSISLFFFVIFLILNIYILQGDVLYSLLSGVISFLIYFVIYKFAFMYYKKEAFGLGDVFYIGVVGFCLGPDVLYLTVFFPFIVAFVIVVLLLLFGKIFKLKQEIPFAPFISISAFILSIYGEQMMTFIFVR